MSFSRETHKIDRVTITLVPRTDERALLHIPSTFNKIERTYSWKTAGSLNYMLVPTRISSGEIKVDLFVDPLRKGKSTGKELPEGCAGFRQREDPDGMARPATGEYQPSNRRGTSDERDRARHDRGDSRNESRPVTTANDLHACPRGDQHSRLTDSSRSNAARYATSTIWATASWWSPPTGSLHSMSFFPTAYPTKAGFSPRYPHSGFITSRLSFRIMW